MDKPRFALARTGATVLLLTTLLRAATLFAPFFNSDESYLATQAHVLNHGGRLYFDTADRKPPLVPVIYAATFRLVGSDSLVAIHVLAILIVTLTTLVVGALARRFVGPRAGAWAMLVYLCASSSYLPCDTVAANFELFMLLPVCAAMLIAGRDHFGLDALAGVLVAVATLMKQTAAITAVPILLMLLGSPRRMRSLVMCAIGGLATTLVACQLFSAREMYVWSVGVNTDYLSSTGVVAYALSHGVQVTVAFVACHAALAYLVWRAARHRGPNERVLFVWLASSAVAVATGYRFFGHYYQQLLPAAALLAASAVRSLSERARRRVLVATVIPAIIGAIACFFDSHIRYTPHYEDVASFIASHTSEHERVAIWGNEPEIYWASGREPATRIVHTDFLTGVSGGRPDDVEAQPTGALADELWGEYFADLEAHAPRYFLDASITGLRHYALHPLTRYPALKTWIDARYHAITTIDGVMVYERYGVGTAPSSTSR